MRPQTLLLCGALTCAACKSSNVATVQPTLQISPTSVSFPLTADGAPATSTLTLTAVTAVDVQVTLALDGGAFTISPSGAVTVPGASSLPITVTFAPLLPSPLTPSVADFSGSIALTSNDPKTPSATVPIKATAQAPELDLCWNQPPAVCLADAGALTVDFGTLAPRQMAGPLELDLSNLANVPLTVTGFALDSAAQAAGYAIVEQVTLPITLSAASGLTDVFHVTLDPQVAGTTATGHLVVTSDDPRFDGGPAEATLTATVQAAQPPVACLGIKQINYIDGQSVTVDPAESLSSQPAIVPPGPLDSVVLTADVSATCSYDPQDLQALAFAFALADPTGSSAELASVSGHPEETTVQFDVAGTYVPSVTVTDSASLTASAQLDIPVVPQSDLEAVLQWTGDHQVDLDLHLVRQLGDAGTDSLVDDPNNDCFWCNCLLASNYNGGSPCGTGFSTQLQWGTVSLGTVGNPLLVANQGYQPLPSQNLDDGRLTGPQPGATYGLYAHYYQAFAPGGTGSCNTSADCTTAGYPTCWANACVPDTSATLRVFVAGQDLFDGGAPLSQVLSQPCDLWHAADLVWTSGGHLSDGGFSPPVFTFTPVTQDGGLGNDQSGAPGLVCGTK